MQSFFDKKCVTRNIQGRINILNAALYREGAGIEVTAEKMATTLGALKRKSKIDRNGICIDCVALCFEACPEVVCSQYSTLISSTPMMQSLNVHASGFEKLGSVRTAGNIRSIMPLF